MIRGAVALAVLLLLAGAAVGAPLRVCLGGVNPPFSVEQTGAGFDVAVAKAVAGRLGQTFAPQWFEDERDDNRSAPQDVGALLASGVCDLVAGYPLTETTLGAPSAPTARVPGYAGGPPFRRLPRVALQALVPSRPYYRLRLTVVLGAAGAGRRIGSMADLAGLRTGAPAGTLSGALLLGMGTALQPGPVSLDSRGSALAALEGGELDAALVEVGLWAAYRAGHPGTVLRDSGWRHRIGFNAGFVGLRTRQDLLDQVSGAVSALIEDGTVARLAEANGLPWEPPEAPDVTPQLTPAALRAD